MSTKFSTGTTIDSTWLNQVDDLVITPVNPGLSSSTTAGIGYITGAGSSVTQLTSKATPVTINRPTGQIITHNASLAGAASVYFLVSNNLVADDDCVFAQMGTGFVSFTSYTVTCELVSAGGFYIKITNTTGGALTDAIPINFVLIRGSRT